jgi:putative ABC transport system substrate-binding protein
LAAKRATSTVPIVFAVGDPVQLGIVSSLARPGGNVTGYSQAKLETSAKYLSLLKELLPRPRRVGVLEQSMNPFFRATRGQFEVACKSLDIEPVFVAIGIGETGGRPVADIRAGWPTSALQRCAHGHNRLAQKPVIC